MHDSDEQSFENFVGRTGDRLLRSAVLLVGDRGLAEDLVQGALERTYRHWKRVGAGHPEAYVRRALVNAAASRWRRRRGQRSPELPLSAEVEVPAPDHADAVSLRDELVRALATLPARQRAVLVLRYFDDLSEADTAAALGCSVGSVKSHASRGLATLRTHSEAVSTSAAAATTDAARRTV